MEWDFRYLQGKYGDAGAREKFEDICLALLQKMYPGQEVHTIRVEQGDGGIDILIGDFSAPIHVFQCKFFLGKISDSQRNQIRESFKAARDNPRFTMKKWTLMIPVDMSQDEQAWWSAWKKKHETDTLRISFLGQSELLAKLREYQLYDIYFDAQANSSHYLTEPPEYVDEHSVICRGQELGDITGLLRSGKHVLMSGFGGIGKTALAKLVFHTVEAEYDAVAWIDYRGSLKNSLLAEILLEDDIREEPERWRRIQAILGDGRKKLFIIDNADHTEGQNPQEDAELLRLTGWENISVIVTSRLEALGNYQIREIDFLSKDDCVALFCHYRKGTQRTQEAAVRNLVKLANCHTLTVELFAKGARRIADLDAYYGKLEAGLDNAKLEFKTSHRSKMATIIQHLRNLFDMQERTPEEMGVLRDFAVLPADAYLTQAEAEHWFGHDENVLNVLAEDGWLQWNDGRYFMHPLVQQIIRLDPIPEDTAGHYLDFVEYFDNGYFPEDAVYSELIRRLELAESVVAAVCGDWDTVRLANIFHNMGVACWRLARYDDAAEYDHKALAIKEAMLGKEHLSTATTFNNLAGVYQSMGDLPRALEYNKNALAIYEAKLGKDHPNTATTYNNLSVLYRAMGDYPKALEYHEKALTIREARLGKDHPDTAATYNNLASVYRDMGDLPRALEYLEKDRAIREARLGKDHPDTATTYNNLATVYRDMDDYPKALEYHEKALTIREAKLGKEHPDTAQSCNNLGALYYKMEQYSDACDLLLRALRIRLVKLGPGHPYTRNTYAWLSYSYQAQHGETDSFLPWLRGQLNDAENRALDEMLRE